MNSLAIAALAVCLPAASSAQEFEVVSVKLSGPPTPGMKFGVSGGPGTSTPGTITWSRVSLVTLIATAYQILPMQIANSERLSRAAFDVTGKCGPLASKEQIPSMLRKVLEERFHLAVHQETKEAPVYLMSVARAGSKLKSDDRKAMPHGQLSTIGAIQVDSDFFPVPLPGDGASMTVNGSIRFVARAVSAAKLAELLTPHAGRFVIDSTGLKGVYDVRLVFFAQQGANSAPPPPGSMPQTDGTAGIFTVLREELGLKLDPGKRPVKFTVIDHADNRPAEN